MTGPTTPVAARQLKSSRQGGGGVRTVVRDADLALDALYRGLGAASEDAVGDEACAVVVHEVLETDHRSAAVSLLDENASVGLAYEAQQQSCTEHSRVHSEKILDATKREWEGSNIPPDQWENATSLIVATVV